MKQIIGENGLTDLSVLSAVDDYLETEVSVRKKILLVAPDITRFHGRAGTITEHIYQKYASSHDVKVLVALGSHVPMTREECLTMFGSVPFEKIIFHNWRNDVVKVGEVPASFVSEVSNGLCEFSVDVELNKMAIDDPENTTVISIGQVVPHEVVGMANGNKNIFVGIGGSSMINSSHMLGAICDMEKIMGRDFSSVRRVFDYAEQKYLGGINLSYILTVMGAGKICGVFMGRERKAFEGAVALSQKLNLNYLDKPLKKVIVNLDEREYRSTWLGNKAIYRTRLAIDNGGDLIILAKGVEHFGEDKQIDTLIRKYGYVGRDRVLELSQENADLKANLSAAAHLIHGSSNGRFNITYCVEKLTKEEVEGVNFKYASYKDAVKKYDVKNLKSGFNTVNGEEVYYIENPSVGLWAYREWFK